MAIILKRLAASGPNLSNAEIVFDPARQLIRGPSDTGKSYIRDCLWYLLGGDKLPKTFPEADGYESLILEFQSGDETYHVQRALAGGGSALYKVSNDTNGQPVREPLDLDEGELLVQLSGASGRKILRSTSDKGGVTGGDLRHWFLLSQPTVISEDPTSGTSFDKTQRIAAFNLFLTGSDDTAIELRKSTAEVERIKGQLSSAEDALKRIQAGLSQETNRKDVEDALARVDDSLSAMTDQYDARAALLREVRTELAGATDSLMTTEANRDHSASMVERFELLDKKYASDLERLGATNEGIGVFQALPETPCPLCGTPAEQQIDPKQLKAGAASKYRQAISAEADSLSNFLVSTTRGDQAFIRRLILVRMRIRKLPCRLRRVSDAIRSTRQHTVTMSVCVERCTKIIVARPSNGYRGSPVLVSFGQAMEYSPANCSLTLTRKMTGVSSQHCFYCE